MLKLKLSGPQKEIVEVLAHIMAANHIASNVDGMLGFFEDYIENYLTDRQRAIYDELKDRSIRVRRDIADMLEKEDKADA
jgi:hypothetical protein